MSSFRINIENFGKIEIILIVCGSYFLVLTMVAKVYFPQNSTEETQIIIMFDRWDEALDQFVSMFQSNKTIFKHEMRGELFSQ